MKLLQLTVLFVVCTSALTARRNPNKIKSFGQKGHGYLDVNAGKYYYGGEYKGKCGLDGLYYKDDYSFVFCSNGNHYIQPCAPGTRNSGFQHFNPGQYYSYSKFCDVNLVDFGYAANAHSYHYGPKPAYNINSYGRVNYHSDKYPGQNEYKQNKNGASYEEEEYYKHERNSKYNELKYENKNEYDTPRKYEVPQKYDSSVHYGTEEKYEELNYNKEPKNYDRTVEYRNKYDQPRKDEDRKPVRPVEKYPVPNHYSGGDKSDKPVVHGEGYQTRNSRPFKKADH